MATICISGTQDKIFSVLSTHQEHTMDKILQFGTFENTCIIRTCTFRVQRAFTPYVDGLLFSAHVLTILYV